MVTAKEIGFKFEPREIAENLMEQSEDFDFTPCEPEYEEEVIVLTQQIAGLLESRSYSLYGLLERLFDEDLIK